MAKKYQTIYEIERVERYDLEGSINDVITKLQEWYLKYGGEASIEISSGDYERGVE